LEVGGAGAVLCRFEDDRVDEADERRVGDAVVDFEIVQLLLVDDFELDAVQSGAGAEGLRGPRQTAELAGDLLARGDAERDRMAAREAKRVDAVNVLRV